MKMRLGMRYKKGDILLVNFPFTDLISAKKRPVLAIKDENEYGDIVCFQITSKKNQSNLLLIEQKDISKKQLKLISFVKYDKCFTIDSDVIKKKLTEVNSDFVSKLKNMFCDEVL